MKRAIGRDALVFPAVAIARWAERVRSASRQRHVDVDVGGAKRLAVLGDDAAGELVSVQSRSDGEDEKRGEDRCSHVHATSGVA